MNLTLSPKARQILATVAPILGTALGGPLGAAAGGLISQALGTTPGDSAAVEEKLAGATPDQLLALQKANNDFKVQMKQLGVQEEQLAYADTASARQREEAVKDWTPRVIACCVLAITLGLEGAMLLGFHRPTQIAPEILGRIFGTLDSATILILGYYFGSSAGARSSAESLAQIAKQP